MTGTDGPARTGGGRCRWCLGPAAPGYARCYCCAVCRRVLGTPPVGVHPARYFRPGDPVHRMLRGYKDAPVAEVRGPCRGRATGLLARLAGPGGAALAVRVGGPWDVVATVPSSTRPGSPPVDDLVAGVPALADRLEPLLARGPGGLDHHVPSVDGFVCRARRPPAAGTRVLVVDDGYTTGARAQSAAATLRRAGYEPAGVAVVGRTVEPDASAWARRFWESLPSVA